MAVQTVRTAQSAHTADQPAHTTRDPAHRPAPVAAVPVSTRVPGTGWAYHQPAPGRFERLMVDSPREIPARTVVLRFEVGGICGSDIPPFMGVRSAEYPQTGQVGAPLHEVVGTVLDSTEPGISPGDRVVGTAWPHALREVVVAQGWRVRRIDRDRDPVSSIVIQPLATVLCAVDRLDHSRPGRATVLGLGPMGLLWAHVLADRGWQVTGVDRVDRDDAAAAFGLDHVDRTEVTEWAAPLADRHPADGARPTLVVDAIGRDQEVVGAAIRAVARDGQVYAFGLPSAQVVVPMHEFFRKRLSLRAGDTDHWDRYLALADRYARWHPELLTDYVTDVYPLKRVTEAFERYARPEPGRLKVVVTAPDTTAPDTTAPDTTVASTRVDSSRSAAASGSADQPPSRRP